MHVRNGPHGYGLLTKSLHWLTFLVVVAQFVVGYTMETDDSVFDRRDEACEATADTDAAEAEEERCEERVDRDEDAAEDDPSDLHVVLGIAILVLAGIRVLWRRFTPLPPWSDRYGKLGRTLQHWLEKAMLLLLFLVPVSGLLLSRGDAALALHVASHVAFYVVVGAHIVLQVAHRHVGRML
ncbi:cytochrome b/b6 domain-containing protein [Nocardioides sp.]|uniref:cytochrome b/b6 domain-containing protein n=1 Tax=Nocardioides sp. TaxID=35761 RepID=UPI001A1BD38C|nr:cytochrome b/b6 domain-containing protein [Nocardioides sp.]MBJ7358856.1 cytochrome b/b6 domain-containing protein [Nocardioides sp.]